MAYHAKELRTLLNRAFEVIGRLENTEVLLIPTCPLCNKDMHANSLRRHWKTYHGGLPFPSELQRVQYAYKKQHEVATPIASVFDDL